MAADWSKCTSYPTDEAAVTRATTRRADQECSPCSYLEILMIKEVIVVEGKNDIAAVQRALQADCIQTGGFRLAPATLRLIDQAYARRGIIILTDPDSAGERIRRKLAERYPKAGHAFVPRGQASAHNDVGIEQAQPRDIAAALTKVRTEQWQPVEEFTMADLAANALVAAPNAADRRDLLGARLGIGYTNAKQFLYRLNHYGVTRTEFTQALREMEEKDA